MCSRQELLAQNVDALQSEVEFYNIPLKVSPETAHAIACLACHAARDEIVGEDTLSECTGLNEDRLKSLFINLKSLGLVGQHEAPLMPATTTRLAKSRQVTAVRVHYVLETPGKVLTTGLKLVCPAD